MTDTDKDLTGHYEGEPVGYLHPDDAERLRGMVASVEEHPIVEVMQPAGQAAPPAVREKSALEHAAEELMATPGAPGRDEFLVLATTARILSMSAGAPKAVRDNPWLAFHLALIGRDLGISPSAAIAQIDVIGEGEDAQLSLSPELLNGQIRRMGLGSIVPANKRADGCFAVALLPGGRLDPRCARSWPDHIADDAPGGSCRCTLDSVLGDYEFTWEDARQAGLVHRDCKGPTEHTAVCLAGGKDTRGKRCHQGYRTYPKRMMFWRASTYCQSDYFPEAGIGIYQAEELGAVVDPDTGRPYDPGSVELPEGYQPPELPPNPADDLLADAADLATERDDFRARIDAIKTAGDEPRQALRALWEQTDDDGHRLRPVWEHLRRRDLAAVRGMLSTVERRIKRGEFGDDIKRAWVDASVSGAGFGKAEVQPTEAEAAQDAATTPMDAQDTPGEDSAPEPAESARNASETPTAPQTVPRPSSKAQAVKQAKAAVDEMDDTQVAEMVLAYEHDPIEDAVGRRGQLIGLMVDEWEAEKVQDGPS